MMEQITSLQNEYIKSLCRLHSASGRKESGLFLVEGKKLCEEAIRSGLDIECCLVTEKEKEAPVLKELTAKIILIADHVAKKLSTMDTVPGIFTVIRQPHPSFKEDLPFILALDHVSDPSNLGAILRSAEAFGADAVFLSEGCVDLYSPKVLRAAMGSAFRVAVQRGSLSDFISHQKKKGYRILGAGLDRNYRELPDLSFDTPTLMVIGNEANGITEEINALCDHGVFIPMLGKNESLNAAVAASILLWEQSKWR